MTADPQRIKSTILFTYVGNRKAWLQEKSYGPRAGPLDHPLIYEPSPDSLHVPFRFPSVFLSLSIFQTQMQSNEFLREILGVSKWGGTGGEKPFYSKNSGVSKQQTTSRTRSRHSKQIAQDHILGGSEDR